MKKPGWFFTLLKLFNKLGFVNASIYKFVSHYIGDAVIREQLYKRWISLRKLKPDRSRIKSLVTRKQTPLRLVYGRPDRIILASVGERFKKGIERHCTLDVIPSGHQVLHEKHLRYILAALQNGNA